MERTTTLVMAFLVAAALAVPSAGAASVPPGGTFVDDDGNIHEGAIEAIAALSITRGCNPPANDRYCPKGTVSRGQMAAFLVRALGLTDQLVDPFVDDDSSIYEADIEKLAAAGITYGCNPPANDRYCPDGTVTRGQMAAFLVRAFDYTDAGGGDLFLDDDTSIFEGDIDRLGTAGVTKGCNPPDNDLFCPDDPVARDQMASFLTRALGLTPMTPDPRPILALETVVSGLDQPMFLTAPAGDERLFIIERDGRIRIFENDALIAAPFLDISDRVGTSHERGLLGLAFHPDYETNGRFFVYYATDEADCSDHRTVVSEFTVSAGDENIANAAEEVLLSIDQPLCNHEGGTLAFGPDGNLFIGTGDGGGKYDPDSNGQNPATLLGAMLRIDVDSGGPYAVPPDNPYVGKPGADEIYAIGMRNPWRFSIDGDTIYVGDVGQEAREEINVFSATEPGLNFGWPRYEGTLCVAGNTSETTCETTGMVFPVIEHFAPESDSITGGYVYRGSVLGMEGHYFYGDYSDGYVRSALIVDGIVSIQQDWTSTIGSQVGLASFGVDGFGELYLLNLFSGSVQKLAPADGDSGSQK